MKAFSLKKKYVPTFAENDKADVNDQLVVTMSMPTVQDVFSIAERMQKHGVSTEVTTDNKTLSMDRNISIAQECGEFLPKYIELSSGAEGFAIQDVISYPPYFPLAVELLFALLAFAQPNEADAKN